MMIYLAKFIGCSGLLLAVYHLLLKNKAMYRFNRVFLLAGMVFSLCIPVVKFEQHVVDLPAVLPAQEQVVTQPEPIAATGNYVASSPVVNNDAISTPVVKPVNVKHTNYILLICLSIYGLVTSLLLYRFIRSLYKIRRMTAVNERIDYWEAQLVLIPQRLTPHSFFRYIFLNRDDHQEHKIEDKILHHELAHTRQYHSADVVFAELVQVFCWFNPFLILYRRSIQLNHEFLADEAVLGIDADVIGYQNLLLSNISAASGLAITSQFSYKLTKKRLIMMTKRTSAATAAMSRLATFVLMAIAFVVFCNAASVKKEAKKNKAKRPTEQFADTSKTTKSKVVHFPAPKLPYFHIEKGVSQKVLDDYAAIAAKYPVDPQHPWKIKGLVTEPDYVKMLLIYKEMSVAQQEQQVICFTVNAPTRDMIPVSNDQLEAYKNKDAYGVWINYKQVNNSELDKYKAVNLVISFVGKVNKATSHTKYNYQVSLLTNDLYQAYRAKNNAWMKKSRMIIRSSSPDQRSNTPVQRVSYVLPNTDTAKAAKQPTQIRFPHPYYHASAGVPQDMLNEYAAIIKKYETKWGSIPPKERKLEDADKARLIAIYRQMSLSQQAKQIITFQYGMPLRPAVKPTEAQLMAFKNPLDYGVWIDDKKISNSELYKYKAADFGAVMISRLTDKAIDHNKYHYQVDLLTVKYNEAFRKQMKGDELKDHMWTKMGPNGFGIKDDKYRSKKPTVDTTKKATKLQRIGRPADTDIPVVKVSVRHSAVHPYNSKDTRQYFQPHLPWLATTTSGC